jgi:hypothetical protein
MSSLLYVQVLPVLAKVLYVIGKLQLVTGVTNTFILPISDISVRRSSPVLPLPRALLSASLRQPCDRDDVRAVPGCSNATRTTARSMRFWAALATCRTPTIRARRPPCSSA